MLRCTQEYGDGTLYNASSPQLPYCGMTLTPLFLFATGIENSSPTIDNGKTRIDELEKCSHYKRWREDFALVDELGVRFLRYGVPLYKVLYGGR